MNSKRRFIVILCVTIAMFIACVGVIMVGVRYLDKFVPKGEHLPNDTVIHYDEESNPIIFNPSEDENFNFLVMGYDRMAALTDVTMLVNFNVTEGKISIMQFPRDTYVSYGVPTSRINATYNSFYNEERAKGSDNPEYDSVRRIADMIEKALCTKISYCAIMNLDGFCSIVDAIGGVEVNIPKDMYYPDKEQGLMINLKAGVHLLNGKTAEEFIRFRQGYVQADLGRQDAQKIFMSAFLKKVTTSVNVGNITELAEIILDNLYTNVSVSEFVYFAKALLKIDLSNVTMLSLPINATNGGQVVMVKSLTVDIMNEYFNVYDGKITPEIFDKDRIFVTDYDYSILNGYNADTAVFGGKEYTADNVNDDSIYIP